MTTQSVICPNCGKRIPLTEALTSQIEAELRKSFDVDLKKHEAESKARMEKLLESEKARIQKQAVQKAEEVLAARMSKMDTELAEAHKREKAAKADFQQRLAREGLRLEKIAGQKAEEKAALQLIGLQNKLKEKTREIAEVRRREAELDKQKVGLVAREKALDLEIRKKTEQAVRKAEQQTVERIEGEHRSKELELEKKLRDAKNQATALKRRLEQSSEQAQGEVAELELENVLSKAFPDDKIKAVEKGKAGADILQEVFTPDKQSCGSIIWESKNTNNWSKSWLPKLRNDQRRSKAELAILVSRSLPKNVAHFAQVDGVWVTEYALALGLGTALRINLIQVSGVRQSLQGKHEKEKVESLFAYLSGPEFGHRVEAIVEAFQTMQEDLENERRVTEKHWAQRGKQLQLVLQNVSGMYGDLQGIIGQTLPRIRRLELPSA